MEVDKKLAELFIVTGAFGSRVNESISILKCTEAMLAICLVLANTCGEVEFLGVGSLKRIDSHG
jgi:hypothetical protein